MQKKHIILILAGILFLIAEFTIKISSGYIDIFSDILAYIFIIIGIIPLVGRNNLFKKSRTYAIVGIAVSLLAQAADLIDWGDGRADITTFTRGLATVIIIYFTYYFTESVMLEAKMQNKSAITRNFRISWGALGVLIFINFLALMTNLSTAAIVVQAMILVCGLYYINTVYHVCEQLYTSE